jgi:hypothetical protein
VIYTADSPILGTTHATPEQCSRSILSRPHGEYTSVDIASVIVPAYFRICAQVGVDPLVAVAQMCHETGNLTSWWSQRPRRNPAGIGVTGATANSSPYRGTWVRDDREPRLPREGCSFARWDPDAVSAHVGRLLAYALPIGVGTPEQQALIKQALAGRSLPVVLRGSAPTLKQLGAAHNPTGRGWASPGTEYGERIAAVANAMLQGGAI